MKLRTFFLTWLGEQSLDQRYEIDMQRFFKISEREYVLDVFSKLHSLYPQLKKPLDDFKALEQKRFHIIDAFNYSMEDIKDQVAVAIEFCAKTEEEQRQSRFKVNPLLSEFLVQSKFQWYGPNVLSLLEEEGSYLFAPSLAPLPPKELVLDNLNTLLLDLQDYSESFTYDEFFNLVQQAIEMDASELNQILLHFICEQVLYYRTLLPVA